MHMYIYIYELRSMDLILKWFMHFLQIEYELH